MTDQNNPLHYESSDQWVKAKGDTPEATEQWNRTHTTWNDPSAAEHNPQTPTPDFPLPPGYLLIGNPGEYFNAPGKDPSLKLPTEARRAAENRHQASGEGGAPSSEELSDALVDAIRKDLNYEPSLLSLNPENYIRYLHQKDYIRSIADDYYDVLRSDDVPESLDATVSVIWPYVPDAIPASGSLGPVGGQVAIDRELQIYGGVQFDFWNSVRGLGEGKYWSPSGSIMMSWLGDNGFSTGQAANAADLRSFYGGHSDSADAGYGGIGGGLTKAHGNTATWSLELGLRTSGFSLFGHSYNWVLHSEP